MRPARALPTRSRTTSRLLGWLSTIAVVAALALTAGCGSGGGASGDDGGSGGSGGSESGGSGGTAKTIDISVQDGQISPDGERVDVGVGQEIDLQVIADAPGEIHVHSDPEHEFEYEGTGQPEDFSFSIDRPGLVEVESHTLEQQILQLQVQ